MSILEIKKMTVQERVTTMEHIWVSLCHVTFAFGMKFGYRGRRP